MRRRMLLATVAVDGHHSAYIGNGAVTPDPTLLPDYDADEPEPGTPLLVVDRDGWATLHSVLGRHDGTIEFGPRLPWPDGSIAARFAGTSTPSED